MRAVRGHPESHPFPRPEAAYGAVGVEYARQCGRDGHVVRVHVR